MIINEKKNIKVFTDNIEYSALEQVYLIESTGLFRGNPIRIMPDCHTGTGCVIGFTAKATDRICPNIVGVDLNCGMYCVSLGKQNFSLSDFDEAVKKALSDKRKVQASKKSRSGGYIGSLQCKSEMRGMEWTENSMGTLGGGNHFIELDKDEEDNIFLIIHTGSRDFGKAVAQVYQRMAEEHSRNLSSEKNGAFSLPKTFSYLEGKDMRNYLLDVWVCCEFADENRRTIATNILSAMKIDPLDAFTVPHNYIDKDGIVRKGAISAKKGERVLIPLNMRDGCILGYGKGNEDWNYSAPHGAGRLMSRSQAKKEIALEEYKTAMKDIYSSTINESTIDESPFAYKPSEEIVTLIEDTVEVEKNIKPIYNFKSGE